MFILVNKPKGITSHDVVDYLRKISGEKKIGHAGTLDPNAEGLLILGIGRDSTKKLKGFLKSKKTYEAQIFLGAESSTDDNEGIIISKSKGLLPPGIKEIKLTLKKFIGKQKQIPPVFSAIKIKGKKAYELARKGENFKLNKKKIEIYSIKLLNYRYPLLNIETFVSSGTYIRALARDIGRVLGCGAYLMNLKRTSIGKYSLDDSVPLHLLNKRNFKKFTI